MFSSPMSHFFRHALLSYHEVAASVNRQKRLQKLSVLEKSLELLQAENPGHQKVHALLEKIRTIKESVKYSQGQE